MKCETNHRPVPRSSRSNLLKSFHRSSVVRSIDRRRAPMRKPFEGEMKEARILAESGPLRTELGGVRLRAVLSRMHLALHAIKPAIAAGGPRGAHERDQTRQGLMWSDDVVRVHV
jgi:hypothetical protein